MKVERAVAPADRVPVRSPSSRGRAGWREMTETHDQPSDLTTAQDLAGQVNPALVIWPSLYEAQRRVVLASSLLVVDSKVQREGDVVHIVATRLHDGSDLLASVGDRDAPFRMPHGRGDEVYHGSAPDPRSGPPRARDIYIPDLFLDGIRIRSRDFR